MEKRISYSQFQQVKSAAKMMDPNMRKIEALKKKIMPLVEEMKTLQSLNDSLEEGIVKVIGVPVYQLVKKVIEPTGSTGKDGKPIKVTKYLPTDAVSYDEQKKQYVIQIADAIATETPANEEEAANFHNPETTTSEECSEETTEDSELGESATEEENGGSDLPWSE